MLIWARATSIVASGGVDKLGQLSRIFAIGICTYAVMINHYHLVLKVDAEQAQGWSEREVAEHWVALLQWPQLVRRWYQRY